MQQGPKEPAGPVRRRKPAFLPWPSPLLSASCELSSLVCFRLKPPSLGGWGGCGLISTENEDSRVAVTHSCPLGEPLV